MESVAWLRVCLRPSSLYSIRLPYTYQSALTYPVLPPSAVQGLAANALQRAEGGYPWEVAQKVESQLVAVHATLADRAVWGTYMMRGLKVEGAKDISQDALPRSYVHSHAMDLWYFADSGAGDELLRRIAKALASAPVTLGDSESLAAPCELEMGKSPVIPVAVAEVREFCGLVPARVLEVREAGRLLYWMAPTLGAPDKLVPYYLALREDRRQFKPGTIEGVLREDVAVTVIDGKTFLIAPFGSALLPATRPKGRQRRTGAGVTGR